MATKRSRKTGKTFVLIVLDKSGSMNVIRQQAIDGFNSNVKQIKLEAEKSKRDTIVCLTTFSEDVRYDQFNVKAKDIQELTWNTYVPDTVTALFDAVGGTIEKADKELSGIKDKDSTVLMIIISDGQENSSRVFNPETIAKLVREKQALGNWTVTYLGAEQDLSKVEKHLGIPKGNMQVFARDAASYKMSAQNTSRGIQSYFVSVTKGGPTGQSVNSICDFYDDSQKDQKTPA